MWFGLATSELPLKYSDQATIVTGECFLSLGLLWLDDWARNWFDKIWTFRLISKGVTDATAGKRRFEKAKVGPS